MIEKSGRTSGAYACETAIIAFQSERLPGTDRELILLSQYDSREAYDRLSNGSAHVAAPARFESTCSLGMERWREINLIAPHFLLGNRFGERAGA